MTTQKLEVTALSVKKWRKLVYLRLEEIDSPRSLAIYMIMNETDKSEGFDDEVLNLAVDPMAFNSSAEFMSFYEPTELVRKSTVLRLSTDPREAAIAAFWESEEKCRKSNRRIRTINPSWAVGEILHRAEKMIARILPEIDHKLLDSLIESGGWGPGVTSSCKGKWLSEYNKITAEPQCSPAIYDAARALIRSVPLWNELHADVKVIPGSTVGFVPKDARTHRAIAVEPSVNAYLQKALGGILRKSLRKWDLDLRDQSRNQRMAFEGSKGGHLATIDLSSASDTISKGIVERLLPQSWVTLLGAVRSERFSLDGKWYTFHKWSSMGNGYTFELETMIFGSLVKAVLSFLRIDTEWSVYGDDIVIDVRGSNLLAEVLEYCGFSVNQRKSYVTGPFRESCGQDFFLGDRVRPFYLKQVEGHTPYIYANWLLANRHRLRYDGRTYRALFRSVPRSLRFMVPKDCGLMGFEVDRMEASLFPAYRPRGLFAWYVTGLVWRPHKLSRQRVDGPAAVLSHLRDRKSVV